MLQCIYRVSRDGILGNVPGKRWKMKTIVLRTELAAPGMTAKPGPIGEVSDPLALTPGSPKRYNRVVEWSAR
jgi:hypothetical protein